MTLKEIFFKTINTPILELFIWFIVISVACWLISKIFEVLINFEDKGMHRLNETKEKREEREKKSEKRTSLVFGTLIFLSLAGLLWGFIYLT